VRPKVEVLIDFRKIVFQRRRITCPSIGHLITVKNSVRHRIWLSVFQGSVLIYYKRFTSLSRWQLKLRKFFWFKFLKVFLVFDWFLLEHNIDCLVGIKLISQGYFINGENTASHDSCLRSFSLPCHYYTLAQSWLGFWNGQFAIVLLVNHFINVNCRCTLRSCSHLFRTTRHR
jgi:hypothetical protein